MRSEPDGQGGRGAPGRNKRGETGDGRGGRTPCPMTGTHGRPEGGIEDRALGSRREGGRDFLGRALIILSGNRLL